MNHVRVVDLKPTDIELFEPMFIQPLNGQYPHDALHILTENAAANQHNLKVLQLTEIPLHMIPVIDLLPKNIPRQKINEILIHKQSKTGGLAQVMLTVNIDLQDNLVNGQLGTIKHISIDTKCNVTKMYIKLDDSKAGLRKTNKDTFQKSIVGFQLKKWKLIFE